MDVKNSNDLNQTDAIKRRLTTVGYEYLLHRQKFEAFLNTIVELKNHIPSLVFHGRTESQIEFTYLGQRFCIRHEFKPDAKVSVLASLSKASADDDRYCPRQTLTMDNAGNLSRPNDKPLGSVRNGSERAFYYLLLGEQDQVMR